mmetsp:Transcript_1361/g.2314  ORF Transcript_1361/g.2314 Transcript_1361/m.2314 type:complete len:1768 (+) Transcript_1361:193-5496(+)
MAAPAPSQPPATAPPAVAPAVTNQGQGVTPNPLPAAPPVAAAQQPLQPMHQPPVMQPPQQQLPPPAPAGAPGHPMPTHYQHQSQPLQPANPLPQQQVQPPAAAQGQPPQPMQQPPPVQHPPPQRPTAGAIAPLVGGWQSDKDIADRRKMIAKIVHLLRQRKPNAPQEWLEKLPAMAKRLEESLYRSAASFEAYNDINTLKQRLQQLAMTIGTKTRRMQQAQAAQQQQVQQQQIQQQQQVQQQQQQQPGQPLAQPQQQYRPPTQQQQVVQRAPQPNNGQPMAAQPGVPMQQHTMQIQQQPQMNPNMAPAVAQANYQQAPAPAAPAPPPPQPAAPAPARQTSDRQQVLRHQQQRLLLLRHAAKCPHQDNQCPVTPHCAGMKRLWKHIAECKDQKCMVPHCVSSRYVLSHYHRCKDVRCPVCGPVREAIHRSHEKQKQMQALKQGHQQALQQNQLPAGSAGAQPPTKRQKTTNGQYSSTQVPYQQQQQQQVRQVGPNPNVKGGYVYNKPAPASAPSAHSNGKVLAVPEGPKPQEDHTLINCFTLEQIETHIKSLNQGLQLAMPRLKQKCGEVLKGLQSHAHGWVFNSPVDPVELNLPDYFEVIEKPMDLGTVKKKLENGVYRNLKEVEGDINLTFDNAMLYNPEGSVVSNMAKELKEKFAHDWSVLMTELHADEEQKRKNGDACSLCGCEKLLFEPPVFYCNGMNCRSKRIRRNSYFFVGGNNQYHWCQPCYDDLKEHKPIQMADITLKKSSLDKKKNNEVPEESWVQCDRCERWIHQICALFNTRQNKDQRSEFVCASCTVVERKQKNAPEPTSTTPMAEDLPRTVLSEQLEKHIRVKLKEREESEIKAKMAENEGMTTEEAKKLVTDNGGEIYVRQVSSMTRTLEVMPRMKKRYSFKKEYPSEFKFRCKCLILFQNLDGVDVILFGLYVYEHDESNAPPNQRAVYISYLDSIYYMRPRKMRTFVYHELLTSYLDYVRCKGYSTAHIWACPPLKGDDYILFAKPEDQKIPKDERLRQWYIDMLQECQRRGIVGKMTNAYDLYFANPKNDATVLPYMEGDYFPGELENIIKDIDEGKNLSKKPDKSGKGKKDGKKKKKAKKGGREGTRSGGLDADLLAASGIQPEGVDIKSLQEGGRDYVMQRLGETINRMKDNFIVAYLNWDGQSPENMVVPKDIMEYREKHGIKALKSSSSEEPTVKIEELDEKKNGDSTKAPVKVESADTSNESPPSTEGADSDGKPAAGEDKSSADADGNSEEKAASAVKEEPKDEGDVDEAKPEEAAKENGDVGGNEVSEEKQAKVEDTQDEKDNETSSKPGEEAKSEDEKTEGDDAKEKPDAVMSEANGEEGKDEEKKSEDVKSNGEKKPEGEAINEENDPEGVAEEEKKSEGDAIKVEEKPEGEAIKEEEKSEGDAIKEEKKSEGEEVGDEKNSGDEEGKVEKPGGEAKAEDASAVKTEENKDGDSKDVEMKDGDAKDAEMKDAQSPPASKSPARDGKFAAMEKRKKELGGDDTPEPEEAKSKPDETPSKGPTMTKDSKGRLVKIIDDDEEEMDCEFLNNRQLFLNLCQGNHYQFDSLRRAKHTSMMVLWHLHNRDAPKFVQQCALCSREILQGVRFHCPTCADFDMCQDCRRNPSIPPHPHPLQPIPVGSQQSSLTPEQRKERQRSIQLHMTLLLHASTCRSQECQSANCAKMKGLLKHGTTCKVKANGGCNVCKRIWALLQIHAKQCKQENCPVPNCMAIRERYRQLQLQQQAMDDRRRQMMNQTYHQEAR